MASERAIKLRFRRIAESSDIFVNLSADEYNEVSGKYAVLENIDYLTLPQADFRIFIGTEGKKT